MAPAELFLKITAKPFEPFRIVLSDGSGHNVTHPELIKVGTRTSVLGQLGEKDIRIDNLHITQLVPLTVKPVDKSVSNGEEEE